MNNCGWGYTPHPKRKLIQGVLINGMCLFEDEVKTAVRKLVERTFNGHSFEAYLYNYSAFSKTEHEPQSGEPMSAELSSRTSPFASTATSCSCSPLCFAFLVPHAKNCAFII